MKRINTLLFAIMLSLSAVAQSSFSYQNKTLKPSKHCFYVDYTISSNDADKQPFAFGSLREALRAAEQLMANSQTKLTDKSKNGITIYIAPGVYWIDNPDDPETRRPLEGENIPYGMKLKVNNLHLVGLTDNPEDVIIASNRGQTLGAVGNFTMLHFDGDDIEVENITFGNYCNVDLEYKPNALFNRKKRSETIVQAQLIICNSDRVVARNCRFISRLNSCPFAGAKRALFHNCYFECTDDALCGTAVYLNSRFTFFSGKPFYSTQGTGAVFLNCDIHSLTQGKQYLTKVGSPVAMVDCRWTSEDPNLYIGWTQDPDGYLRCYQQNVTLNGKPLLIDAQRAWTTVDMTGKKVLNAYKLQTYNSTTRALYVAKGEQGREKGTVYNIYNLLRGNDDWDPTDQKRLIKRIGKEKNIPTDELTNIPVDLLLSVRKATIESGVDSITIDSRCLRFYAKPNFTVALGNDATSWSVQAQDSAFVKLTPCGNGSCMVSGINNSDSTRTVHLFAYNADYGLQAASVITVKPRYLDAPSFVQQPRITADSVDQNSFHPVSCFGKLSVEYLLRLNGRDDHSIVTWYRCTDSNGSNAIPVATSRMNTPLTSYNLSAADVGYYIKVSVAPKHIRSRAGKEEFAITSSPIEYAINKKSVASSTDRASLLNASEHNQTSTANKGHFQTDFLNFPTNHQPKIIPGFWTVDGYKPTDTQEFDWMPSDENNWYYGKGFDGAARSVGLLQGSKGARLLYTPIEDKYGDMRISLTVDPCKTAGQGFGSATGQYMDVYIKFCTSTLSGYALRIIRTTKHDKAVDFMLMRYDNGVATAISKPISSICYRAGCTLQLSIEGNRFTAHAETTTPLPQPHKAELTSTVDLEAEIVPNHFGGIGIQHTGSTGASATVIRCMTVDWE